jgi:hypothetical protein
MERGYVEVAGSGSFDRHRLQARSVAWSEPSCLLVAGFGGIDTGHRGASSRRRLSRKRTGVLLPGNRDWCASCQPPTRGCGERGCGGRWDRERSMDWTRDFFCKGVGAASPRFLTMSSYGVGADGQREGMRLGKRKRKRKNRERLEGSGSGPADANA